MKGKHMSWFLLGLVACIFAVNVIAMRYHLYFSIFWLDIPMHFSGGLWLGLAALWLYFLSGRFKDIPEENRNPLYVVTLSLISAIVFGSLWEGYEFGLDVFIRLAHVYDMKDTISDLCMDILGAFVAAGYFIRRKYYSNQEGK